MYLTATLLNPLTLTVKEAAVLRLLCVGYSDKAIGHALNISAQTVKAHLKRIYLKLNVSQMQGNTRTLVSGLASTQGMVKLKLGNGDRRTGRDGSRRLTPRGSPHAAAARN